MEKNNQKKVMVGMSGGVDSSVSAYILQKEGYDVTGATMDISKSKACSASVIEDAKKVAEKLGIAHYVFDFKDVFDEKVVKYFVSEYLQGRTPNPCIMCNRHIKFEELLEKANGMDIDYIATGHYAKVEFENGRYLLKKSASKTKDQTYVLYNLTQDQLSKVIFPLEGLTKDEVRDIAKDLGLSVADKPESQEICFVEDNDYSRFISESTDTDIKPGNIVDTKGNVLGRHDGIYNYTVGQRKGIRVPSNKAYYVLEIDIERNEVVIGDESETYGSSLVATDINLISIDKLEKEMRVNTKIRYGAQEVPSTITPLEGGNISVVFDSSVRAITSGQSVVFYDGDVVVGGGVIL